MTVITAPVVHGPAVQVADLDDWQQNQVVGLPGEAPQVPFWVTLAGFGAVVLEGRFTDQLERMGEHVERVGDTMLIIRTQGYWARMIRLTGGYARLELLAG